MPSSAVLRSLAVPRLFGYGLEVRPLRSKKRKQWERMVCVRMPSRPMSPATGASCDGCEDTEDQAEEKGTWPTVQSPRILSPELRDTFSRISGYTQDRIDTRSN
ncbi:hypothetical protein MRX96_009461 [Rhipicephalus microplus]